MALTSQDEKEAQGVLGADRVGPSPCASDEARQQSLKRTPEPQIRKVRIARNTR